jgi:hypothetical protein
MQGKKTSLRKRQFKKGKFKIHLKHSKNGGKRRFTRPSDSSIKDHPESK